MNLELARVNAARHRKTTADELVDPPVRWRNVRPPTPRGHALQRIRRLQRARARISYGTTATNELWNSNDARKYNRPLTVRGSIDTKPTQFPKPRTRRGNLATKHEAWGLPEIRFN